jgi:hypothetical protein
MLPCAAQVWHKTDDQLLAAVQKEACPTVCLDATGQMLDSLQLSDAVFKKLETGGSRLCFVIGGAEGLPPTLRPPQRGNGGAQSGGSPIEYLSLSRLTFTHQVTLGEQTLLPHADKQEQNVSLALISALANPFHFRLCLFLRWRGCCLRSKSIAPRKYDVALATTKNRLAHVNHSPLLGSSR